ncbi:jg19096 [Pararge aegeria aegeria]|uniref:Jg19096 protein n=1 Tax=Pararge aegeria aegeria TaxID=348720 RepID=A0A8S4SIK9_9NEOP|nr:jg19096 [Pararge aegeria aegeria]
MCELIRMRDKIPRVSRTDVIGLRKQLNDLAGFRSLPPKCVSPCESHFCGGLMAQTHGYTPSGHILRNLINGVRETAAAMQLQVDITFLRTDSLLQWLACLTMDY